MKILIDCYTVDSLDTKFPENTYVCASLEEAYKVIADVSKPISGIKKVEIWFDRSTERISAT